MVYSATNLLVHCEPTPHSVALYTVLYKELYTVILNSAMPVERNDKCVRYTYIYKRNPQCSFHAAVVEVCLQDGFARTAGWALNATSSMSSVFPASPRSMAVFFRHCARVRNSNRRDVIVVTGTNRNKGKEKQNPY